MNDEYSFGSWIRRRRKELDLTQRELAERVNCSLATIVKIESDQRRPSRQLAELLAQQLEVPQDQWDLFIKVARGLKIVDQLAPLPIQTEQRATNIYQKPACNLPLPTTPLLGRGHELDEVDRLIMLPECRLLTITGPGGIGKTRLALQAGREISKATQPAFPDGICFVPLASVASIENIPKAIARALRFDFSGPLIPEEQLLNYLMYQKLLLLLDNAEHLLEGALFFASILERTAGIKLLVTSRERLNLMNEWVFDLQSLPVPPLDAGEGLEDFSSVKLFLDRARQARSGFTLRENEHPIVARICRYLNGIPLGIELAAAWVRTLPLDQIAVEISRQPDFLTTAARDIPERHRSLRVVFEHSWALLSPEERSTLKKLSVFRGDFSVRAALEVVETQLITLKDLIDKSLLHRIEPDRYELHELVRMFSAERLAETPEEKAAVYERFSAYFLMKLQDIGRDLQSNRQKTALSELSQETANIRAAWDWTIANGRMDRLQESAWSLWYFFDLRNYYREAAAVFRDAASMAQNALVESREKQPGANHESYTAAMGQFLMHQAYFNMRLGRVEEAEALCQASISALRSVDAPEALAHALTYHAVLNWTVGRQDRAWNLLEESLPLSREHGPPWQIALFTAIFGNVAYEQGAYEQSYRLLDEALDRGKTIGDPRLIGFIAAYFGRTALKLKRLEEAARVLQEGARQTKEAGDRFGFGLIQEQKARLAFLNEEFPLADRLFKDSIGLFQEIGDSWSLARTLTSFGDFRLFQGKSLQASELFRHAVSLSLETGAVPVALDALAGLARYFGQSSHPQAAYEIAVHVVNHPASMEDTRSKANQILSEMGLQLGPDELEVAQTKARDTSLEAFVGEYL